MNLLRAYQQKRLDVLEMQAYRLAVRLNVLISQEWSGGGRLNRLLALEGRACKRANRRHDASIKT